MVALSGWASASLHDVSWDAKSFPFSSLPQRRSYGTDLIAINNMLQFLKR
jgi:hypothetical protein